MSGAATPLSPGRGPRIFSPPNAVRALLILLAVYTAGFLLFYPPTVTVADEGNYIRQAELLIRGSRTVELVHPITGQLVEVRTINDYPLGTALLLVPFVAMGGREAAHLLSLVCTLVAVGVTARWLHGQRFSPLWAVLVLAYPATAIMGRVAMSEAPSLMIVAVGLWVYWRGTAGDPKSFLLAGFLAGFSFAVREANVLLFAPLFIGSVVRRDRGWSLLVVGGCTGLAIRLVSAWFFFDDPFFAKQPDPFSLAAAVAGAPLYLFCLLVLVPGGLVAAFLYRGPRRAEVQTTIAIFVVFHLLYGYSAAESGFAKRLVLGPRYFIPLLPLLALAAAEVWPRVASSFWERRAEWIQRSALAALVAIALGISAIHWVHGSWAAGQATIRDAIYGNTEEGSVIIANGNAVGKFIDHLYGGRLVLDRRQVQPAHLRELVSKKGGFYVVMLDRTDSAFWRRNAAENSEFMATLAHRTKQVADLRVTPTDHLRIWKISE